MMLRQALQLAVAITTLIATTAAAEPFDTADYSVVLRLHTRDVPDTAGVRVDYAALAGSAAWQRVVSDLARAIPDELGSRDERLAFWINAYNILAIDLVVHHYPVESIRDIGSLLRPVWKRDAGIIDGRPVTLDWIEHDVLRPLGEPRIHAAIVCASVSCPSLRREPWSAIGLDEQLDRAMERFLAQSNKGLRIDEQEVRVTLSKIFDWFEKDFRATGGVMAAIRLHAPEADRDWLARNPEARLDHFDYDWGLNDTALAPPGRQAGRANSSR